MRCLLVAEHAVDAGREREFVLDGEPRDLGRGGRRRERRRAARASASAPAWTGPPARRARRPGAARAGGREHRGLDELGHWGVPVFVLDGELFWGQDRIEDLEAVLRAEGLER